MRVEVTEVLWVEEHEVVTETQLVEASGLSGAELRELTEYGILVPAAEGTDRRTFSARAISQACTARRLRRDFGLSADGLALAMTLLDRIRELESQVGELRAQLPPRSR